ncbi:hypothetical protein NDU88_008999 [Pleurodeles waltl]|uniref:Uncharacterized protein n=1 Tax=Pleurodeles waltl TaxID=8319 RepID=A0AAV7RZ98_PLEWA|nr:hypothetical protein NDU88_008999 [Pleurodeles waltl]
MVERSRRKEKSGPTTGGEEQGRKSLCRLRSPGAREAAAAGPGRLEAASRRGEEEVPMPAAQAGVSAGVAYTPRPKGSARATHRGVRPESPSGGKDETEWPGPSGGGEMSTGCSDTPRAGIRGEA